MASSARLSASTAVGSPEVKWNPPPKAKPEPKSYRKHAQQAVIWNAGFNILRDVLQFAQMVVLTRILEKAAYGSFAFATSAIGFLAVFSTTTFSSHTLQVKDDEDAHFQDHFTAAAVLQIAVFLIANVVALYLGTIPEYAAAAPLMHVMSLTYILEWPCEIRRLMIQRQFDFRMLRILQLAGLVAGAITAVIMGLTGCGAYSLAIPGMLVTIPFTWDLLVRQRWRPTWTFSWKHYKPAFDFGLVRIGSGLALKGRALLEMSTLTAIVGFASLGVFNRAMGLANLLCMKTASQLVLAVYPIITRLDKSNGAAERAGDLLIRVVGWFIIPAATLLSWLAGTVVTTMYGPKWNDVIPLMKWALACAVAMALTHVVYQLVLARNRPRVCFYSDMMNLVGTGAALAFGLRHGMVPYLEIILAVTCVNFAMLIFVLMSERALSSGGLIRAFAPPVICTILATLVSHSTIGSSQDLQMAIVWGAVFSVTFVGSLRLMFGSTLAETVAFIPGNKKLTRLLFL